MKCLRLDTEQGGSLQDPVGGSVDRMLRNHASQSPGGLPGDRAWAPGSTRPPAGRPAPAVAVQEAWWAANGLNQHSTSQSFQTDTRRQRGSCGTPADNGRGAPFRSLRARPCVLETGSKTGFCRVAPGPTRQSLGHPPGAGRAVRPPSGAVAATAQPRTAASGCAGHPGLTVGSLSHA